MKNALFLILFCSLFYINSLGQKPSSPSRATVPLHPAESLDFISQDLEKIAKSVEQLNKDIVKTYVNLLNNQGLVLTENQQKILVSFEILIRAERRLATLQKTKIELAEKLASVKAKIGELNSALRRENIDRSVALRGTTNAEELRSERRRTLNSQKSGLDNLINEIQTAQAQTDTELLETNQLVQLLRKDLFPAIYRELPKLKD